MRNSIITVIGTPKSGISILGQCLRMLGITSLDDHAETDTSTIHGLLFHDLDHSPTMAGPFPQGWMQSPGAKRARQRIGALLTNCRNETGFLFLAAPFLCRFMPLWAESFQEAGLSSKFVLMVRHPWESAPSLARVENINLAKAHLLWLAQVRDSFRACQDHAHVLVTFDQLLADPISTLVRIGMESKLTWPNNPWSVSSSLLDFVQLNLRRHHVSNLPDKDKQVFLAYEQLYQEIRRGQWSGMADDNAVDLHPLPESDATLPTAKGIMPVQSSTTAGPDLVESLLNVVGQYEKQAASRQAEQERTATEASPPLFAQVVFPSSRKSGEVVETIPLIADQWQHITLPVPEPKLLCDKPVILKPLNTNGTVMISALKLVNLASREVLWAAQTPQDFEALKLSGTVLRIPDLDNFILFVTGDEPCLNLPNMENLPNCPVGFGGWMRANRNQSLIIDYWEKEMRDLDNVKHQLKEQSGKILVLTQSMDEAKNQIKDFSDILSKCNFANVFQSFNRRLENEHIRVIKNKWLPLLELELKDSHLRYLAHKICQVENRCSGRLATTVQDALLRVIVAMSVRKRAISIMEIGSLFGVALVSCYECLRGLFDKINLTAIDPLEGYYDIDQFDILTRTPVNKSIFESNLLFNNVPRDDVLLIQELSTSKEAFHLAEGQKYDLMIIDGNHTFEGVKYDFDKYNQLITPGGFVFFDDYNAKEWPGVKSFVDQEVRLHSSFKLIESEWRSIVFQKMEGCGTGCARVEIESRESRGSGQANSLE